MLVSIPSVHWRRRLPCPFLFLQARFLGPQKVPGYLLDTSSSYKLLHFCGYSGKNHQTYSTELWLHRQVIVALSTEKPLFCTKFWPNKLSRTYFLFVHQSTGVPHDNFGCTWKNMWFHHWLLCLSKHWKLEEQDPLGLWHSLQLQKLLLEYICFRLCKSIITWACASVAGYIGLGISCLIGGTVAPTILRDRVGAGPGLGHWSWATGYRAAPINPWRPAAINICAECILRN